MHRPSRECLQGSSGRGGIVGRRQRDAGEHSRRLPGTEGLRVPGCQYARYRHGAGAVGGLACLAILLAGMAGADIGTDVTLIRDGSAITLSEAEQSQIARRVETLIVGCAITSVRDPDLFATRALAKEWQDVRAGSHLYVRFPTRVRAERGGVE